jgi:phosphate transport system protein
VGGSESGATPSDSSSCEARTVSVTGVRTSFHEQLDALLAQLSALCRLTEVALAQATHALLEVDLATAEQVITDHDLLAALAQRCEERAVTLLALQAPVARDLRTVVATLNLVDDLLRMGVLAQHVARIARRRHPHCAVPDSARTVITAMAGVAVSMATAATTLLIDHNTDQAAALVAHDATIDALRDQLTAQLLAPDWDGGVPAAVDLTQLGRWYERYADHTVAIAGHITYLTTAQRPTTRPDERP